MGNASGREEAGGDNPCGADDPVAGQVSMADQDGAPPAEDMGQSPPTSPRASQSPLMFRPQMPVVPLQRPDELHVPSPSWMQTASSNEDTDNEKGIPTMIMWSHGGKEVIVEGSWDDWKSRKTLQRSGKDFTIMKVLPSGVYQYKFLVDGLWRYSPDQPWDQDDSGNAYNILDLQFVHLFILKIRRMVREWIMFQKTLTAFLVLNHHNPRIPATTICSLVTRTLQRNRQWFLHT